VVLSYKYRIEPTSSQAVALTAMLADFCDLYNAGLQQRIEAYRRRGISVTYEMQATELRAVRAECASLSQWSFSAQQQVLRRLDKSFKAFFGRIKRGETPGFCNGPVDVKPWTRCTLPSRFNAPGASEVESPTSRHWVLASVRGQRGAAYMMLSEMGNW
jgi:putative transposase